ncbi:MAG: hypothetical protein K5924_12885 [Chloroflexi bacterium]|nr:hypothetical protein [Chloroflexota bacterium]
MQIVHAGELRKLETAADLQSYIRESLAPINLGLGNSTPVGVSVRLSQSLLRDAAVSAANLKALLGEYHLELAGVSAVNISAGLKNDVHAPDWRSEERLAFMFGATNLMAEIAGEDGAELGITTNALSHRSWLDIDFPGNWAALMLNVVRVVQHLATIREKTGVTIHVDLEVEPGSVLRDTHDVIAFWNNWVLTRGAAMLSDRMQVTDGSAADAMNRHLRLAIDTAHMAVVGDDAATSLDQLTSAGIGIGRLQISAALEVEIPDGEAEREDVLANLNLIRSGSLLQQVVATRDGEIVQRYEDLPEAISPESAGETWRIHTHAPVLADRYGAFRSTRAETADWIQQIARRGIDVGMIELRSANWDVVPADDRGKIVEMVKREVQWVRSLTTGE